MHLMRQTACRAVEVGLIPVTGANFLGGSLMPKCPTCKTENNHVYHGAIHVECTNLHCRNFDQATHDKFIGAECQEHSTEEAHNATYEEYLDAVGRMMGGAESG